MPNETGGAFPAWQELDPSSLPDPKQGPFLCTNNINSRNAHGRMSHVWLTSMFHKGSEPRDGDVCAFDGSTFAKVCSLSHYAVIGVPLPPAPKGDGDE